MVLIEIRLSDLQNWKRKRRCVLVAGGGEFEVVTCSRNGGVGGRKKGGREGGEVRCVGVGRRVRGGFVLRVRRGVVQVEVKVVAQTPRYETRQPVRVQHRPETKLNPAPVWPFFFCEVCSAFFSPPPLHARRAAAARSFAHTHNLRVRVWSETIRVADRTK